MSRILIAFAAALFAGGTHAQVLGFGSAPQGSIGYNMSSAIARVMAEDAKVQSRVQPYSGSSAVLPLVNSGELEAQWEAFRSAEAAFSYGWSPRISG